MRKVIFGILIVGVLFGVWVPEAEAALLTLKPGGEYYWNVLGVSEEFGIELNTNNDYQDLRAQLLRSDNEYFLQINDGRKQNVVNVTDYEDEVVEIVKEEESIAITILEDGFGINQTGVLAYTSYPISIDTGSHKLSVETETGVKNILIMPQEVLVTLLRTKIIDRLVENTILQLKEGELGELSYEIKGEKVINLLNLVSVSVPIETTVSALTGEVLQIDKPTWYKILGFMFV